MLSQLLKNISIILLKIAVLSFLLGVSFYLIVLFFYTYTVFDNKAKQYYQLDFWDALPVGMFYIISISGVYYMLFLLVKKLLKLLWYKYLWGFISALGVYTFLNTAIGFVNIRDMSTITIIELGLVSLFGLAIARAFPLTK